MTPKPDTQTMPDEIFLTDEFADEMDCPYSWAEVRSNERDTSYTRTDLIQAERAAHKARERELMAVLNRLRKISSCEYERATDALLQMSLITKIIDNEIEKHAAIINEANNLKE